MNRPSLFGLGGAMGAAPMMGLGLALAQPKRRVLVATGDGELLMNVGALATIALQNPPNLTIICVDNGHYGETGNQESHTGLGVRLDVMAAGCRLPGGACDQHRGRHGGRPPAAARGRRADASSCCGSRKARRRISARRTSSRISNGTASGPPCLDDAFALLRLQFEWGADEAIALEPLDRLRPARTLTPSRVLRAVAARSRSPRPVGTPAERARRPGGQARDTG